MSMIGNFLQLSSDDLATLIADPSGVVDFIYPDEEERADNIDIDKAWHGIHYMLSGDAWGGELPLANVVLGGTEIGDDAGYGPALYITAEEVQVVADALRDITPENFRARYDAAAMKKNEIYPGFWDEAGDDVVDYLASWFDTLRDYYIDAASKGLAMLKYIN
ncbi:YfbM family protein [Bremerella sp.]|uniref:YfbM family protein n=1 Tax=Bremerella sp. TaxID=2795602 RepID=UPI00391B8EB5